MGIEGFIAASAILLAAPAAAQEAGEQPDLGWLSGYWLSCEGDREVSETWSARVGAIMLGYTITSGDDAFSWEQARIDASGGNLVFVANPWGTGEVQFPLKEAGAQSVVFESPAHDFPSRVIYRREGDRLHGRIEGMVDGKAEALDWHYRAAPFNSRCK